MTDNSPGHEASAGARLGLVHTKKASHPHLSGAVLPRPTGGILLLSMPKIYLGHSPRWGDYCLARTLTCPYLA